MGIIDKGIKKRKTEKKKKSKIYLDSRTSI